MPDKYLQKQKGNSFRRADKKSNIRYKSKQILDYYRCNRQRWDGFYASEKWAFRRVVDGKNALGNVLDVGCACGGLGLALCEKFFLRSYTGVDINRDAIVWAKQNQIFPVPVTFRAGDIVRMKFERKFDLVVSLSCADWNIETGNVVKRCWENVKTGGYFVISLRLTPLGGVNDIVKSYQYINFSGKEKKPEIANYVVFNFNEALSMLKMLRPFPELIGGYGYWGKPAATAVTFFDKLVFAAFFIKKGSRQHHGDLKLELRLPPEFKVHV